MTGWLVGVCAAVILTAIPLSGIAQEPVTLMPTWDDPGPDSSEFGRALAVTGKFLYVGAPKFNLSAGSHDAGRVFIYNQKTLEYSSLFATGFDGMAEGGAALSATKKEVLMAAPGRIISGIAQGQAALISEKSDHVVFSNPEPANGDRFGSAVAVDKKLVVIGAPGDVGDSGGHLSGSAFVAQRKNNVLLRLSLPAYQDGDRAGEAVAVSKKFIAVGAPGTDLTNIDAGAVHIYDAKDFSYIRTLSVNHSFAFPQFGSSLAFSGNSLFVGAPTDSYGAFLSVDYIATAGAVYEFDTRTWTEVQKYSSANRQADARFGHSIAVDKKNLIIGSPTHDNVSTLMSNAGIAEVFDRKLRSWKAEFMSRAPLANEEFGSSLAMMKKKRIAVGSPMPGHASLDGAVNVFSLPR